MFVHMLYMYIYIHMQLSIHADESIVWGEKVGDGTFGAVY